MKTDTHLYTLSRSQFAKQQGKSRDAIKKAMKRGYYKDEYIFIDGQYKFKNLEGEKGARANHGLSPVASSPLKPKVNRGGHEVAVRKGRYPNVAFAQHNHMKKLIALRGKLSAEELALIPTIEHLVKQERRQMLQKELELTRGRPDDNNMFKNYGSSIVNESNKGYNSITYHNGLDDRNYPTKYRATKRGSNIIKKGPYEI